MEIKVKSVTDVITNSSSESFVVKRLPGDLRSIEEIREELQRYHDDHLSIEGEFPMSERMDDEGCFELEVGTVQEDYEKYRDTWVSEKRRGEFTRNMYNIINGYPDGISDGYITIEVDEGWLATIDHIVETLFVLDVSVIGWFADEEGRYYKKDINEWMKKEEEKRKESEQ